MSKAYRCISSKYIDSQSVVHKRGTLYNHLNTITTNISTIMTHVNSVGTTINSGDEVTNTATMNQSNDICSINIPAGTWIVIGHWIYENTNLSSYTALENITESLPDSRYDNEGWVNTTVVGIKSSNSASRVWLNLWPRNKTVSVKAHIIAIRIK